MNPGLLVKLRPTGPWRIGPDSGARNRVDAVYHSDSLYAAVCSAMARLGLFEEWLDSTARAMGTPAGPAVAFSSCFPFQDDIRFVAPPRTIWPPTAPALLAARVRWKSARFVPLAVAETLLAGKKLDENRWSVDGLSECLVPAGAPGGPFRSSLRSNAAVDRMSGVAERHSTACLEFRAGAGLWSLVAFADEAARDRWAERVKAAFRWLADAGFGGERSRGWGRSETPEFSEGELSNLILTQLNAAAPVTPVLAAPEASPASPGLVQTAAVLELNRQGLNETIAQAEASESAPAESAPLGAKADAAEASEPANEPASELPVDPMPEPVAAGVTATPEPPQSNGVRAHWLLSLFTPAAGDNVDWSRGNYTLLARGGRVETSGELKKNLQMVAEGSVIYAREAPRGSAPDVAPDGSPHPVFRAGFAVSIPLPEAV